MVEKSEKKYSFYTFAVLNIYIEIILKARDWIPSRFGVNQMFVRKCLVENEKKKEPVKRMN